MDNRTVLFAVIASMLPMFFVGAAETVAVVSPPVVATNAEWRAVADALAAKCERRGFAVTRIDAADPLPELQRLKPDYTAFVRRPEEARFPDVITLARLTRRIDDDPLEDTVWGIVSGPTPADALRVASAERPDLSAAMSTTGLNESAFRDFVTFSDGKPEGTIITRTAGGEKVVETIEGDLSGRFADAWDKLDPGFITTSFHASDRNLEIPYARGYLIASGGELFVTPPARLIDYKTAHATRIKVKNVRKLARPKRSKVWIAHGNCLIANNPDNDSLIMALLGYGRVDQFYGYIVPTWYGAVGWGTSGRWNGGGVTLARARHDSLNAMMEKLVAECPDERDFAPMTLTSKEYTREFERQISRFFAGRAKPSRDVIGRLWDRDTTVLWGDPTLQSDFSCVTNPPTCH